MCIRDSYCLVDSCYCTTEQLGTYPFTTSTMAEPLLKAGFELSLIHI